MQIVTPEQVAELRAQLDAGTGRRIASIDIDVDPFDFARTGAALVDRAVAYSNPSGHRLVGLGTAWHATAAGPDRFSEVAARIAELPDLPVPVFVGYAFHDGVNPRGLWGDFTAIDAFLPRIALADTGEGTRLVVTVPEDEDAERTLQLISALRSPDPIPVIDTGDHAMESIPHVAVWAQSVADAVKVIQAGELDKVVLARSVKIESSEPVQILRVFRELVRSYPQCYTFAWKSFGSVFMGASPELLVKLDGGRFSSNPLAGSARRGEGTDEDDAIGRDLLDSAKDQVEHRLVVEDMQRRLEPLVDDLTVPSAPELKKMATVQHLSTQITGTATATNPLELVAAVHPTPAVGGVPRLEAVDYIDAEEEFDRGWYTGGVGYVTPGGDGEIAIALRCGLILNDTSHLFAGAGIVADSDPGAEVVETRLKLRPLLDIVAAT